LYATEEKRKAIQRSQTLLNRKLSKIGEERLQDATQQGVCSSIKTDVKAKKEGQVTH
jgi:hypothetical protein